MNIGCLAPDDKERKTEPKSREGKTRGWEAPVLHWNPKYFTALRTEQSFSVSRSELPPRALSSPGAPPPSRSARVAVPLRDDPVDAFMLLARAFLRASVRFLHPFTGGWSKGYHGSPLSSGNPSAPAPREDVWLVGCVHSVIMSGLSPRIDGA